MMHVVALFMLLRWTIGVIVKNAFKPIAITVTSISEVLTAPSSLQSSRQSFHA